MIDIVLIDSQEIFRDGVKHHLNSRKDLQITGEASDTSSAVQIIDNLHPDIVIIDLAMENSAGFKVLEYCSEKTPKLKVIGLSPFFDTLYVDRCVQNDAKAFILKSDSGNELMQAIEQAMAGDFYLSQTVSNKLLNRFLKKKISITEPDETNITRREVDILNQLKVGLCTSQIASKLGISHRTVETHRSNMFRKLAVKNSIELINKSKRLAIID